MIITCHKCSTNYNLDESLLKPEGTKVRCTVCNNIFKAFPPVESMPATGLEVPDFEPEPSRTEPFDSDNNETDISALSGDNQAGVSQAGDFQDGMIAYLELDEKSLGIEDIIDEIIFIPREPEDFEPETISETEFLPDDPPYGAVGKTRVHAPLFGSDEDSEGELSDLDLDQDDEFDFDDDLTPDEDIPGDETDIPDDDDDGDDDEGQDIPVDDVEDMSGDEMIPVEEELSIKEDIPDVDEPPDTEDIFDGTDLHIPDEADDIQDIETEFSPEDIDDEVLDFDDDNALENEESVINFDDDNALEMEESVIDFENDTDFEFEDNDTLEIESVETSEDEFSAELDFEFEDETDENIDAPDFEEDARVIESDDEIESDEVFESDDGFEFDTDGELTLADDEISDDAELSFDDDSIEEEEEDLFMLEEEKSEGETDGDFLLEETDGIEETDAIDGVEEPEDTIEDTKDREDSDKARGAFELEFDVDPDLGLDDEAHDPDYLLQDIVSEEDEDTLDLLEIESENDGDAFLEDFSDDSLSTGSDEDLEEEVQPEFIIEEDEKSAKDMTRASIRGPVPPPLTKAHLGKFRASKKGGSKIVSFFFFIVFIAIVVLLVYSAGVMTQTKIPYISDLKIPWLDQYLKPTVSQVEPIKVHPTEQSVSGSFVANENAGTLFVITGKVTNESNVFVSHVKVKGTLIAEGDIKVKEMVVSCGNILTAEQLEKSSIDDMNRILTRPEGENNANVRIKPYGSVQFMMVFSGLPDLLKTFEVEVVDFDRKDQPK